jgi:hypothetical protein
MLAFALFATVFTSWVVGQEREIDPGLYAKLYAQENGWRVWRFQTRQGTFCRAAKSAIGRPHPVPLGVGNVLYGGTPYLVVSAIEGGTNGWEMEGRESDETQEFRLPGEKFWTDVGNNAMEDLDGKKIEVHVSGWEYPAIYVGHTDDRGVIDMTGAKWAVATARKCGEAK